jgi:hypothetical protein
MMIYVIELKDGFYYVGRYNIAQLKIGIGPNWTKVYLPVSVIEEKFKYGEDEDDIENKLVYKYMEKYGIDKVRGGSYNSTNLSEYQINCLNNILKKNEKTTYKSKESHSIFIRDDDFTTVKYDSPKKSYFSNTIMNDTTVSSSPYICSYCEMMYADENILKKHEENCVDKYFLKSKNDVKMCERCGRNTHTTQYCKAKTDIHGYPL